MGYDADLARKSEVAATQVLADAAQAKADLAKTAADTAQTLADTANNKATSGISRTDMAQSNLPSQPRLRVNRAAALNLTTSWQRVDFTGTSTRNANTFPMMNDNATPYVKWDGTNKLFKFGAAEDRNYQADVYLVATNSALVSSLLGQLPKIQYKYVVPNGVSAGVDDAFPFPEDGAYGEIGFNTSMLANQHLEIKTNIYASSSIRTNGIGLELRLSSAALGAVTVSSATFVLFGR